MNKDPKDRTRTVKGERRQDSRADELSILSRSAMEFLELPPEGDLFSLIADLSDEILDHDAIVIVGNYDEKARAFRLRAIRGLGKELAAISKILGRHPLEISGDFGPATKKALASGKFVKVEAGLRDLPDEVLPRGAAKAIEKLLGLTGFHVLSFAKAGKIEGGLAIFTRRQTTLPSSALLEAFAGQAAVALERRRAQELLRETESTLRAFINAFPGPAILTNRERLVLEANELMARRLMRSRLEMIGQNIFSLLPPESAKVRSAHFETALRTGRPEIFEDTRAGVFYLNYMYPIFDEKNEVSKVAIFALDIGERKQAEEALRASEAQYRTLTENMTDIIYQLDVDGRVVFIGDQVAKYGYRPEEIISRSFMDFVYPEDRERVAREFQDTLSIGLTFLSEFRVLDRLGKAIWIEENGRLLKDELGRPMGTAGILRDITERKRAEEALRQSEAHLRLTLKEAINSLSSAIEMRDPYTAGHQEQVTKLAVAIAREMGLSEKSIEALQIAGIVHDIGKLGIPAEILSKPTALNEIELQLIKTHPEIGHAILSKIDFPWPIALIVGQHHETVDGSGYPNGLAGKDLLIESKILNVADTVEAMSSHRPYRASLGIEAALGEIKEKRGVFYEPEVVDACVKLFAENKFRFD